MLAAAGCSCIALDGPRIGASVPISVEINGTDESPSDACATDSLGASPSRECFPRIAPGREPRRALRPECPSNELYRFPYQACAMDFPEAIYATLRAEYDDATGVLTLTDGAFPCDRATTSRDTSLEFQRVVDRLCSARGAHRFKGGAFRHEKKPPALVWPGPKRKSAFAL